LGLEKEGLIPKGTYARARDKIISKEKQLQITEKLNLENVRKFAQAFGHKGSAGKWDWDSDEAKRIFARKMETLARLRVRINFLRSSRGLKPIRFKDNPYY